MKHFLLTRFNIRVGSWTQDKNGNGILDENWFKYRFDLFEKFCFPSVVAQTNQGFTWLLCFDTSTPSQWRTKIEKIVADKTNIEVLYIDGMGHYIPEVRKYIRKNISDKDRYVITTRLDNDDIIHQDYIDTIQSLARPEHQLLIDLRKGYQMKKVSERYVLKEYKSSYNSFISIVEQVDEINTIFYRKHREWKSAKTVAFKDQFMWIQFVHENNLVNKLDQTLFHAYKPQLDKFQLKLPIEEITGLSRFFKNVQAVMSMVLSIFPSMK